GQSTEAAAVLQSFGRRGHCRGPAPAKDAVNECSARGHRRGRPRQPSIPIRSARPDTNDNAELTVDATVSEIQSGAYDIFPRGDFSGRVNLGCVLRLVPEVSGTWWPVRLDAE